ncbi:MAG: hypothetical protein PHT95_04665 [Candidatus Omnitrophica bacterium]|nr:hypothetical protein [Candidatus Omnitrophota bacterium]
MERKKIWLWNVNLAWELFSNGIYNYRKSLPETKEHKKHSHYKNVIFNMVTAVEAYCNELLAKEKNWDEKALKVNLSDKLKELGADHKNSNFKKSKFIRNELLVHYKRIDYSYFPDINQASALEAIESSQDIILEICFNRGVIFPYWITGLNFINPSQRNDISLLNDYEFWCRFKWLGVRDIERIVDSSGKMYPPKEKKEYMFLFHSLWEEIKKNNFKFRCQVRSERFPHMPFLTSEWWDIN